MDVSVIIVNYNTRALTMNCIKSVYASETRYSYEIILVDNASSDDSVNAIRDAYPEVTVIENKENAGFARANNTAAKIATGRYLYIVNSDTEIEKNVIEGVVSYGDMHADAGVIGTRVVFPDGKLQFNFYKFPTFLSEFFFFTVQLIRASELYLFNLNKYREYFLNKPFDVDVISGCSMFVKREVYESIGLFNDNFFMYYEDGEFCYRVKQARFKCIYQPAVFIKHFHLGSGWKERKEYKLIIAGFKAACIYFSCVRSNWYALLFKITTLYAWHIEFAVLRFVYLIVRKEKLERKASMIKVLLNELKGDVPV